MCLCGITKLVQQLQAPQFQPLNPYEVKNWFQEFAFEWVKLWCYAAVRDSGLVPHYVTPDYLLTLAYPQKAGFQVGRCKLNAVDPYRCCVLL